MLGRWADVPAVSRRITIAGLLPSPPVRRRTTHLLETIMKTIATSVCASLLLVGCQSSTKSAAAPGMINSTCPFSGNPVGAGAATADWQGQTVGFCCAGCASRWGGWSNEQKNDYVSAQQ